MPQGCKPGGNDRRF